MRTNHICLFAFFLLVFILGCRKNEDAAYHGTIHNSLQEHVQVFLYSTQTDYEHQTNLLAHFTLEPNGAWEIPKEYETGSKIFVDWYTDDFRLSNWGLGTPPQFNVPNLTPDMGPAMSLVTNHLTQHRRVCLKDETESVWEAIDAVTWSPNSVWNTLTPNEKYRRIVLKKDLTGVYSYKDDMGAIQNMNFIYQISGFSDVSLHINFSGAGSSSSAMLNNRINSTFETALDTLTNDTGFPHTGNNGLKYYFRRIQ